MNSNMDDASLALGLDAGHEQMSATDIENNLSPGTDIDGPEFAIGDVVDVMPRMWSGINKPGGAGRIKAVTYDEEEEEYTYNVRYILHGGIEKNVSGVHINMMNMIDNKQQRGTKGRCTWCRCFIRDCQHDQTKDPYYVEPVRVIEEPVFPIASLLPPTQPAKPRKRLIESEEVLQAKKHKQLQKNEARRLALEASEEEFERQLQAVARRMKLLPDDEASHCSTGTADMDDDSDYSAPEDNQLDPFFTSAHAKRRRVIVDSDDEGGEELALPVDVWDDTSVQADTDRATAGNRVAADDNSHVPTPARVDHSTVVVAPAVVHSQRRVEPPARVATVQPSAMATPSIPNATPAPSTSSATSSSRQIIDLSDDISTTAVVGPTNSVSAHETSAQRLHHTILQNCLGKSVDSPFINNSENSHKDRNPADVNRVFKALVRSIPALPEEEKVHLYVITYGWFEARLEQAKALFSKLDALSERVRAIEVQLNKGDEFGTPLDDEISALDGKLERMEERLTVIFEELERAGFDVFQRLRNIKHPEVRRRTFIVDSWKAVVLDTKLGLHRQFRRIRNAFEDVESAWSARANSYHNASDWEDSEDGYGDSPPRNARGTFVRSAAVPRVRDASKEAGTLVRVSSTTSTSSHTRPSTTTAARSDASSGLHRTGSGGSHKSSRDSTQVSRDHQSVSTKRVRSHKSDDYDTRNYDHDFIDNTEYVPRSDGEGDEAVEEFREHGAGHRHSRPANAHKSGKSASNQSRNGGGEARSRVEGHNSHPRAFSDGASSRSASRVYSKGVQRELDFIFGASNGTGGGSGSSLSRSNSERDSIERRALEAANSSAHSLYHRAPAASVLDLPRHLRYHGRVTVLEGLVSGNLNLPTAAPAVAPVHISAQPVTSGAHVALQSGIDHTLFGYDDYSLPTASTAGRISQPGLIRSVGADFVPLPQDNPIASYIPTGTSTDVHDLSAPSDLYFDSEGGDESLVDVVLSSMVNPFVAEPPLHRRRQFYQLGEVIGCVGASERSAADVWAEEFVTHLAIEAAAMSENKWDAAATAVSFVRAMSPTIVSSVQNLLQRIVSYEEMVARSSQLHHRHVRVTSAQFNATAEFSTVVSLAEEKLAKLSAVLGRAAKHLFVPTAEASSAGRSNSVVSLMELFSSIEQVLYNRAISFHGEVSTTDAKTRVNCPVAPDLRVFLRHATLSESKSSDLDVHIALNALRMKALLLKNCALHTLELAKTRPAVDTSDVISVMDRMETEAGDWDVFNACFEQLQALQSEVIFALLGNQRVLLAVLHGLSTIPSAVDDHAHEVKFEKGIGGIAKLVTNVLYETLVDLRTLHVAINTARSACVDGVRVWSCYDASREQANGIIATYPKNVWRRLTLAIYAHIAHSNGRAWNGGKESKLIPTAVNSVEWRRRGENVVGTESGAAEGQHFEEDAIWAVMVVFTHCLRALKVTETRTSTTNVPACRVDGAWSLVRGLAQVTIQPVLKFSTSIASTANTTNTLPASSAGAQSVMRLLRRVGHFAALWLDSSTEATALTLSIVNQVAPSFASLLPIHPPLASGSVTSSMSNGSPAVDSKSVLFLCYHAFFSAHRLHQGHAGELELRRNLTRQLTFVATMMFETFKLPHRFIPQSHSAPSALILDVGNDLTNATEQSLRLLDDLRSIFQDMVYNSHTEACSTRDVPSMAANLSAIKAAASKLPRTHQKLPLLALLNGTTGADFQCSLVLFGVISEMVRFFGADAVRQKLKMTAASGTTALPLQQQLMDLLANKLGSVDHSAPAASTQANAAAAGAVTLSEIDQLLQKVPLQQQADRQIAAPTTNSTLVPTGSIFDTAALHQCLLWYAVLVTLTPFPADAVICALREEEQGAMLTETDLKRIVEAQRSEALYLQPFVHLLRHSLQSMQASRETIGLPGVKKKVETSLGAGLAASATILRHIDALYGDRHSVRLDTRAEGSNDVHSRTHALNLLHASLLTDMLGVVHACLTVSAKDGLQNSAAYVMSSIVLYLQRWHAHSRQLLAAAESAINLDATARGFMSATLAEEGVQMQKLMGEVLRVRLPVAAPYKTATNASTPSHKPSGSDLVAVFRALLTSLSGSLKSLEVCGLEFSAEFASSSTAEFAGVASKYKVHKNNLAPGCCYAICQSLGALVGLVLDTNFAPSASTPCFTFAQAIVSEVMESLERVDQAAALVSANGLLGNWLKIVFWSPILKAATQQTGNGPSTSALLPLLCPHFPSLVGAWVGCALAGSATRSLGSIAQQIGLPALYQQLLILSPVLVHSLHAKCINAVSKLSPPELQCLRLAELFVQTGSNGGLTDSVSAAVRFLRLVAAGSTSNVLAALLTSSWYSGVTSHSFPAVHRVAFETSNVTLSREVLKCLQVVNFTVFRYGDIPARAAEKLILLAKAATLKGLFGDIAYMYRVLVTPAAPRASLPQLKSGNDSEVSAVVEASQTFLSAELLRGVAQLPRLVTLDLADSFLAETVELDTRAAVSCMFKCALKASNATAEDRNHVKMELRRSYLYNVPKYLLLASDTPYSTRQTAWRVLLAPLLLTPAHTATGVYAANQRANALSAHNSSAPMLTEASVGEDAYFMLLVCALTLALPVPEQLALLVPAMNVSGDISLRTKFVELVTFRLKLPVKQGTLWELFAQLVTVVKNTCDGATTATKHTDLATTQDAQLTRFKQYVLLGGGASGTQTGASGVNRLGTNLSAQSNALWEQVALKAQEVLGARVAEEQQRQSLEKRGQEFQPAAVAMCLLPWAAVRAALHLHTIALEDVLQDLIRYASGAGSGPDTVQSATTATPPPVLVPNLAAEREELLSLVVCSTFHAVRSALAISEMHNRATSEFSLITESSKNHLQAQLQYCRLASQGVCSAWSRLQALVRPWNGASAAPALAAVDWQSSRDLLSAWLQGVRQLREMLRLGSNVRATAKSFVLVCWQLLQQLYLFAGCNNVLLVDSFLASADASLPPSPQVTFSTSLCTCALCADSHGLNSTIAYDGTENTSSVQVLQGVVVQAHRSLQNLPRTSAATLSAEQSLYLQKELSDALLGAADDVDRVLSSSFI